MESLLATLQSHAVWLFGSGGVAAAALSYLKFFRSGGESKGGASGATSQPTGDTMIDDAHAGGDIVGGNKTTRTGLGGQEVALIVALVVCLGGLGLMFAGGSVIARNCSAAAQGTGNTITVTAHDSCDQE